MKRVLPPGLSASTLDAALKDFGKAIGDDWVLATDLDRDTYLDHFAVDEGAHAPSAAVAPSGRSLMPGVAGFRSTVCD